MSLKYQIGSIGWCSFESLVQTLLKCIIGPGVTSFGGSVDQGRDATFEGTADYPSGSTKLSGKWIFQVKYIDIEIGDVVARTALKANLKKELKLILTKNRSIFNGRIDNYILITDVPLTAKNRDEFQILVEEENFVNNFRIIDGDEVCEFLSKYPDIRRSYPQLLGLADLDVIVNRELYIQSQVYMLDWQPRL